MNQSALQNHYEISECENGYTFFTHSGNQYFVFFIEYPLFDDAPYTHVYSVTIERVDEENHNTGVLHELRNTIIYILEMFFRNHQNALISVCDTEGEKQHARNRLFSAWVKCFAPDDVICISTPIHIEENETYAMLLYMRDNIDAVIIEKTFKCIADNNFYYP